MVWKQSKEEENLACEETDEIMTDEEIRKSYLTAKYPEEQIQILAELTDRDSDEIRAIIAGESSENLRRKPMIVGVAWSDEEAAYLAKAYREGISAPTIAKHLRRTVPSIRGAVKKYGLRRAKV